MDEKIQVKQVAGKPIPLRGNDIDTDRIIPARFMKAVTFDGLGEYAFYDVRFDTSGQQTAHVMNDPRFQAKGPRVAIVNKNFGCGSSREHAPQAMLRWGIKAIIGESFADIFHGNCVALGIPCVTASGADIAALIAAVEEDPSHEIVVDVEALSATHRDKLYEVSLHPGTQQQLLEGSWDATRSLLQAAEQVRETAQRLPYIGGFKT